MDVQRHPIATHTSSHRAILLSSSLMGAQQAVRLVVGVVQAKAVAVWLGQAGAGAFGLYASLQALVQTLFSLGVSGSGVQRIAAAEHRDERGVPSLELRAVIRIGWLLGLLAGGSLVLLRRPVSRWTFGTADEALGVAVVGVAVTLSLGGQGWLVGLQGLRRIRDLTAAHVLGAILSAAGVIALVHRYRERAVAPSFLLAGACVAAAAWWFARRVRPAPARLSASRLHREFMALVKLGGGFMAAGLFATLSSYVVRTLIVQQGGLPAAGLYQAAWMLSSFYCTTVLQAMGADFFPRISAASRTPDRLNALVNEQTEVGLLLVVPGLLVCAVAAPWVLRLLYTAEFLPATSTARWMLAGMLVRAAGWPLAYVPLALNRPRITVATEGVFAVVLMLSSWVGIRQAGLEGAGWACAFVGLCYTAVLYRVAGRLSGMRWTRRTVRHLVGLYGVAAVVFGMLLVAPERLPAVGVAGCIAFAVGCWCLWRVVLLWRPRPGSSPS